MYRIRSGSGAEAVYNSLEEFNAAVRRGAVAPEDEIFHMRANRWLDVKSHPHYRLAISGAGHTDTSAVATSVASRPVPQAPAPRPAPTSPAASQPSAPAAPAAERPQQTVLRPQLVPQPVPVNPPGPPRKSRELAFIDLGGPAPSSQRNATVIEARKAPAPPAAPAKAEPTAAAPTSEVEFLVMDGGIESPVRNSQGLRTIPEDLDLLFDTPMHQVKPASTPTVVAAPTVPKTQVQAAPEVPVTKVERPAIEVTPRVAPKVEAPKVETPRVEPPKAAAAVAAPKPAAPVANVPKTEVATPAVAKLATPAAEPAHAAAAHAPAIPQAGPKATVVAPAPRQIPAEDLTIPGAAILEAPVAPIAAAPMPELSTEKGPSMGMFAGAGLAVVMVVVGLLAWKPWSNHASAAPATSEEAAASPAPQSSAPTATPAPVTPSGPAQTGPARPTTASVPAAAKSTEPTNKTDSVVKPQEDQIIAAARPNFQADADVPSTDLGLGSDIRTGNAAAQTVSPSELTRRLETAEKLAQLELGTKLGGFRSLFTPSRLATAEGVNAARSAWVSGAEVLRQYRAKIARMEKAYEDSVLTAQRGQRWSSEEMRAWAGHQDQAEPVETSQLADLMFSQVSEGLDLLAALNGQYEIKGGAIVFKNPASGIRYTSIRTWVDQRMQAWSGTPESARPYSVSAILRALGDGLPASN